MGNINLLANQTSSSNSEKVIRPTDDGDSGTVAPFELFRESKCRGAAGTNLDNRSLAEDMVIYTHARDGVGFTVEQFAEEVGSVMRELRDLRRIGSLMLGLMRDRTTSVPEGSELRGMNARLSRRLTELAESLIEIEHRVGSRRRASIPAMPVPMGVGA